MTCLMPNFGQVQARYGAESERPNLWTGLQALWTPPVTPTGLTWRDGSMHHNDGTLTNMNPATDWVSSPYGWALDFDSGNDTVSFGDKAIFYQTRYTYAWWMKAAGSPGVATISQPIWNADQQFEFSWDHVNAAFAQAFAHMSGAAWIPAKIPDALSGNTWYFLAATYDGSNITGYLDGRQVVQVVAGTPNAVAGNLHINRPTRELACTVPSLAIWSRALAPSEIAYLYRKPFAMLRRRQVVIPSAVNRRRRVLMGAVA